jgi:hypothetical protein
MFAMSVCADPVNALDTWTNPWANATGDGVKWGLCRYVDGQDRPFLWSGASCCSVAGHSGYVYLFWHDVPRVAGRGVLACARTRTPFVGSSWKRFGPGVLSANGPGIAAQYPAVAFVGNDLLAAWARYDWSEFQRWDDFVPEPPVIGMLVI